MEKIHLKQKRPGKHRGAFSNQSHPAGSGAVLRIRIVVPVPVELRLVVDEPQVGVVVAILAMHRTLIAKLHLYHHNFPAILRDRY